MGLKKIRFHLLICKNDSCVERGGKEVAKALRRAVDDAGLRKRVLLSKVRCFKQCGRGPVVVVYPDGVWYGSISARDAVEIVERHLKRGELVARKVLHLMRAEEDPDSRCKESNVGAGKERNDKAKDEKSPLAD
ncbi:MAG: ferredoxin [Pyrinomonas sp.]|uniref:(2Fe-2S) ferredoxin domain-containing protein n=1 Tax=Pyrinomonas sp. TaxID=2080306 RepID=UPI00331D12E1